MVMFSFFLEKFLRLGCDQPVVDKIFERCSNIDSNLLTLRIGSFGVDQKKFSFLSRRRSAPGVAQVLPGHAQITKGAISREPRCRFLSFFQGK